MTGKNHQELLNLLDIIRSHHKSSRVYLDNLQYLDIFLFEIQAFILEVSLNYFCQELLVFVFVAQILDILSEYQVQQRKMLRVVLILCHWIVEIVEKHNECQRLQLLPPLLNQLQQVQIHIVTHLQIWSNKHYLLESFQVVICESKNCQELSLVVSTVEVEVGLDQLIKALFEFPGLVVNHC